MIVEGIVGGLRCRWMGEAARDRERASERESWRALPRRSRCCLLAGGSAVSMPQDARHQGIAGGGAEREKRRRRRRRQRQADEARLTPHLSRATWGGSGAQASEAAAAAMGARVWITSHSRAPSPCGAAGSNSKGLPLAWRRIMTRGGGRPLCQGRSKYD